MNDVVGFNSRAHGGRDFSTSFDDWLTGVSIHAPTGGATRWLNRLALVHAVSIHAPTGGATDSAHRVSRRPSFNSRAHGGRDKLWTAGIHSVGVSIHAPTGGATARKAVTAPLDGFNSRAHGGRDRSAGIIHKRRQRFQFTRPRGARPVSCYTPPPLTPCFNSRAHGGRDQVYPSYDVGCRVSIHAPTGGAT